MTTTDPKNIDPISGERLPVLRSKAAANLANDMIAGSVKSPDWPQNVLSRQSTTTDPKLIEQIARAMSADATSNVAWEDTPEADRAELIDFLTRTAGPIVAAAINEAAHQWQDIATAPRDGTLFDTIRNGIRYTDCHFDQHGRLVKRHSYPSVTKVFLQPVDGWMPRPVGLLDPYATNADGIKYVPSDQDEWTAIEAHKEPEQ